MKRKIAILLSAMMVASAMPMTASAVQLKGDTDINAGFPKADQVIDTNYNFNGTVNYDANGNLINSTGSVVDPSTITMKSSDLRDRYSVLKLNLVNDGTSGDIKAGTTFKINLENGTFDEDLKYHFNYIQTSDDKLVTYDQAMKNARSLTDVFTNIATVYGNTNPVYGWDETKADGTSVDISSVTLNAIEEGVIKQIRRLQQLATTANSSINSFVDFKTAIGSVAGLDLVPGTENYYIIVTNTETNVGPNGDNTIKIPADTLAITEKQADGSHKTLASMSTQNTNTETDLMKVYNVVNDTRINTELGLKAEIQREFTQQFNETGASLALPHIPYQFEIESDKTAKVTIPVAITEADKKVNLKGASYSFANGAADVKICPGTDTNEISDLSLTNLLSIEKIKVGTATLNDSTTTIENPYIALPLGAVKADSDAPVKVTVDGGYSQKIISGTYTITKGNVEGSTSIVFPDSSIKTFDENTILEPIVVRENTKNTMGKSNKLDELEFVVRLDGGFKFANMNSILANPQNYVVDDSGNLLPFVHDTDVQTGKVSIDATKLNDSAIKFTVKNFKEKGQTGDLRNNAVGLRFKDIKVEPTNDRNYGDVTFTISGDGINTQSKVVARRGELGFKLETTKDPQEMVVGRHYGANNWGIAPGSSSSSGINTGGPQDGASMLEKDNTTVEIKFSESIPNTLVESRQLDFTVPDGVKIVDAKIYDQKNLKNFGEDDFKIVNNGKTLRLESSKDPESTSNPTYSVVDKNKIAEFKMTLDLTIDPAFTGDIKLGVTGGGQGETVETVIAKAKAPFELKTQTTKANMGYQDYNTADIVITETAPGMFLENRTATLELVAPYGTSELGFSEAKFEVSGGELEIKEKDFKVGPFGTGNDKKDGVISFRIDKASHKNPSTVTIKNVKVGTTRSVPYGSYSLALSGDAVINNYNGDINDGVKFDIDGTSVGTTTNLANLYMQNGSSYFEFKDYVNVITETGTLDHTVKVTVGEKTVLVGDQAYDMDVAPYIQASSNSTMVPLRFVSVALGVDTASVTNPDASNKIAWDANTKTTTIYYGAGTGQKIIQFQAGSNIMTVDGTRIPMEYGVKAEIKDGRMFVPFRALGQALGVNVSWDADTRTAIYNADNARNATINSTTAASSTTTESTTESTTASTTTESTTASDSTTESTTAKQQ